jgi:ATP-dependent Zn protease
VSVSDPEQSPTSLKKPEWVSRPRDEERTTRKPLGWWDRSKFLILLTALFWFLVWTETIDNPILPVSEAINNVLRNSQWILWLAALEVLRQLHYVISERSPRYFAFWNTRVWAPLNRRIDAVNPWTRFRLARLTKWLFVLVILDVFVASRNDTDPVSQFGQLPGTLSDFLFGTSQGLPFIFEIMFAGVFLIGQFALLFWFLGKGGIDVYYPDDVKTRFTDIWGQDAVLSKVQENIIFLEDPESIEKKGGYVPGGILLYGPPGTGKTLMAEAVAGETGHPFVFVEPGAFTSMFMGVGILKVRSLFRKLRKLALRYGGVIVFMDEADSLGRRSLSAPGGAPGRAEPWEQACNGLAYISEPTRSLLWQEHLATAEPEKPRRRGFIMGGMGAGGGDVMALQALLAEMSGLKKPRGFLNRFVRRLLGMRPKPPPKYRMLIMMATNMPSSLDQALLRPGRIDRIYKVGYPSKEGRKRTFDGYLAKVKHELTEDQVEKLSVISPYATGATIKDTVNEALVEAIRDGRDTITWPDMLRAKHHKEHGLPDDTEYIDRERHAVAIHEACHAIAFYRLDKASAIDVATIERRGDVGGFVAPIPLEDQFFTWKSERENDIMISLASLTGERMFFDGDNSAGVGGDLRQATTVAMQMEAFSGMGSTVASHSVTKAVAAQQLGQSVETGTDRQWLETPFGARVEARLEELLQRVTKLLVADRIWVLALAHAMEHRKTISGEDVSAIMNGTVGPTVDGGAYHDRKVQRKLEEYHRAALVAHKETSKPKIPFPTFNGEGEIKDVSSDVSSLVPGEETQTELVDVAAARAVPRRVQGRPAAAKRLPPKKRAANGRTGNGRGNGRNGGTKGNGRKRS